jgi:hypothetical protein
MNKPTIRLAQLKRPRNLLGSRRMQVPSKADTGFYNYSKARSSKQNTRTPN